MDAIYLLIPIALLLVVIAVTVFFWAVKSDQFDDLEGPAHSILFDDDQMPSHKQKSTSSKRPPSPPTHPASNSTEH